MSFFTDFTGLLSGGIGLIGSSILSLDSNSYMKKANNLIEEEYNRQKQFLANEKTLAQNERISGINDIRYNLGVDTTNNNGFISKKKLNNSLFGNSF